MAHKHTSGLLRSLFEYLLLNNVIELPAWDMCTERTVLTCSMENVDNFSFVCLLVFDVSLCVVSDGFNVLRSFLCLILRRERIILT